MLCKQSGPSFITPEIAEKPGKSMLAELHVGWWPLADRGTKGRSRCCLVDDLHVGADCAEPKEPNGPTSSEGDRTVLDKDLEPDGQQHDAAAGRGIAAQARCRACDAAQVQTGSRQHEGHQADDRRRQPDG